MKKTVIRGTGGTGKPSRRSQETGLQGYCGNIMHRSNEPKVESAHLLPGGQTQAGVPDTLASSRMKGARGISLCRKGTWKVSFTQNPGVPNRVMGWVSRT
jgi:hypothetical protein